ncbi:neutral/alkaline non-lysosomal ceramidase N-terminal domain-containing protein [Flavobacteriaceae bacterium F89]|uniref:Neutral/alkaline non-lysosomal ceramidase N-terminal domain-containing protein n=1 Tax=Cerina litoralis TaxID=2874477 RepID=A0AAE3JP52_9FLAO|nr:neutral/alkaline non-lysosomal ceramidase N-terminal domain-containing protein [Cerina litoralis]MCG2460424.1 neutral/alkaline non-lysosomal ceramidase N-terminal domain-containing protein [Cerina litoralis]
MQTKKWQRRSIKVLISLAILFLLLRIFAVSSIDTTPYFKTAYYGETIEKMNAEANSMAETNGVLHAGFSKVNITPKIVDRSANPGKGEFTAIKMAGFGNGQIAKGVHDSLYAKAIALQVGEKVLILISADLVFMPESVVAKVKENVKDRVSREQLIFGATHTHSSVGNCIPGVVGKSFGGEYQPEVVQWLSDKFTQVITEALADKRPAKFASDFISVPNLVRNRIIGETGRLNDKLNLFSVVQDRGKKAVIGIFSAHATTIGTWNDKFSGDYPGYFQRSLETNAVDLALFFAGTVGSQSNMGKGEKFDKAKYIGETLADSAEILLKKMKYDSIVSLTPMATELEIPKLQAFYITDRLRLSPMAGGLLIPKPESPYLQGFKLNNFVWIAMPYELSGEYGIDLKNALELQGYDSALTCFNGQYLGYIVPQKYYYYDTYEARLMGWYGPSMGDYLMELNFRMANALTGVRL